MKRTAIIAALAVASSLAMAPAFAANTKGNKFQCFSGETDGGYNGTCEASGSGATLNTIDGDDNANNNYAGVYLSNSNLAGKTLDAVHQLSFRYDFTQGAATGGSPRLSIPIDVDGDGDWDGFAFIDALGCTDGVADSGTVSIDDPTCTVTYENVSYENWAAFAAANPGYRIATDALSFIIVDQPGTVEITGIQLGKGPAKAAKTGGRPSF